MQAISLNDTWTVEYFEPNIDGFEMAPSPLSVPRLPDWRFSPRFQEAGFYAWLQRTFELDVTDYCVRYEIQIENVPPQTRVFVNDQHILDVNDAIMRVDVTNYVSLGENRLSLRVDSAYSAHRFDAAYLLQIPCDEA